MNCFFHPDEVSVAACLDCGKALCKTCAGKHEISICSDCNLKRNALDKNQAVKKVLPSLILFALGFVGSLLLCIFLVNTPFLSGLIGSVLIGWFFGGIVWGSFITKTWFRPKVYVNTGMDANAFSHSAGQMGRIFLAVIVGPFAMLVGFIKLIRALNKAKKVAAMENANRQNNG